VRAVTKTSARSKSAKKARTRAATATQVVAKRRAAETVAGRATVQKARTRATTAKRLPAKKDAALRTPAKIAAGTTRKKGGGASELRVTLEVGPKEKKVVAVAPDWPGLERGGKTGDAAIETLLSYLPRYEQVAKLAGMGAAFADITNVGVVERYQGTGSTDFWGISFAFSSVDGLRMSSIDLDRELALMHACWTFFDDVRRRVSAEMQKGPRGGGRDRDRTIRHVVGVEQDWAKKVGVRTPEGVVVIDDAGLAAYRGAYCAAIRSFHAEDKLARTWPLRYLIRHTAYHTMDHSWEMEDKDLSGAG
jgi:hypothetical protein